MCDCMYCGRFGCPDGIRIRLSPGVGNQQYYYCDMCKTGKLLEVLQILTKPYIMNEIPYTSLKNSQLYASIGDST